MQVGLRNLLAARRNFPSSLEAAAAAAEPESKVLSVYYLLFTNKQRRRRRDLTLVKAEVEMVSLISAVSDDIALNKGSPRTRLFEGDRESEFGGKLRNLDDLFDEITPVTANTSAGNNILARGPSVFGSLNTNENIPEELGGHSSPAALLESIDGNKKRILNHTLRP